KKFSPKLADLEALLGSARYETEKADRALRPGVVTGLAWTAYGGDILLIETLPLKGKGGFRLTGQLGDVMNESANLAYSYVRKLLQEELDHIEAKKKKTGKNKIKAPKTEETKEVIEEADDFLSTHEVHLHLPA